MYRNLQWKSKRKSKPTTTKAKRKLKQSKSSFTQKLRYTSPVMDGVEAF
jgi:hypothetical protein